jgi:hypothetical protein
VAVAAQAGNAEAGPRRAELRFSAPSSTLGQDDSVLNTDTPYMVGHEKGQDPKAEMIYLDSAGAEVSKCPRNRNTSTVQPWTSLRFGDGHEVLLLNLPGTWFGIGSFRNGCPTADCHRIRDPELKSVVSSSPCRILHDTGIFHRVLLFSCFANSI